MPNLKDLRHTLATGGRLLRQTARLMVGVPEYDTYVAHLRRHHPDRPVMTYREFFNDRQRARFGGNGRVGCC